MSCGRWDLMKDSPTEKANVPDSEFSDRFVGLMKNRMRVSFYKYGLVADAYPSKVNAIKSLQQRLDKYAETGNTEYLVDAANFAMIEFMRPAHPTAFFKATDSDGSPGRVDNDGDRTKKRNSAIELNTDRQPQFHKEK